MEPLRILLVLLLLSGLTLAENQESEETEEAEETKIPATMVVDRPSFAFPSVSDQLSLYFEVAGFTPQEVGGPSTMAGDIVIAYLVNPDLQLDVAGFKGFSSSGLDWGATVGISHRF